MDKTVSSLNAMPENKSVYPISVPKEKRALKQRYNIIFIVAESLRAMEVNNKTAPFLTSLDRGDKLFQNHYSSSNTTHFGVFSLLYGISPAYFHDMKVSRTAPFSIEILTSNEYDIFSALSTSMDWYEMDKFIFGKNFKNRLVNQSDDVPLRDKKVTDLSIELAEKYASNKERYYFNFAFIILHMQTINTQKRRLFYSRAKR